MVYKEVRMGIHLLKRKEAGQSLILIALVLAVLIGMVGLSVDVGSAYAEQRAAQRAADAAVLKGVDEVIKGRSDARVRDSIAETLRSNGIQVVMSGENRDPGELRMSALYLDEAGNVMGAVGGFPNGQRPPNPERISYIELKLEGDTETYFARLFARDTLAVNATTYGVRGPCAYGVYPLAVESTAFSQPLLNANDGGAYNDSYYLDRQWRRLYLLGTGEPATFTWLRWRADAASGTPGQVNVSMTADGNINEGFEEAPWEGIGQGPKPDVYPQTPGYLTQGDLAYGGTLGSAGANYFGPVQAEFEWHKNNRTELNLPIYDKYARSGTDAVYRVAAMGRYILRNYGVDARGPWVELVQLSLNKGCATSGSPPPPPPGVPNLTGVVEVLPRYPDRGAKMGGPLDIVMVIDRSSSMTWGFAGNGSSGPSRMSAAKEAAKRFVDGVIDKNDRLAIVGFSGNTGTVNPYPPNKTYTSAQINNAVNQLTTVHAPFTVGDAAGKSVINNAINQLNPNGNTPTVVALERAKRLFNSSAEDNRTVEVSQGVFQTLPVKHVLILLTDGVATNYTDGKFALCPNGSQIAESCISHLTSAGQPINLAVNLANSMKADNEDLEVYVVAMGSNWDTSNLNKISSAPTLPYFSRANNLGDMNPIFQSIKQKIESSSCVPATEDPQAPIDPNRMRNDGVIGSITLREVGGSAAIATVPIVEENGEARYTFVGVRPGQYELSGEVYYRDPDGGQLRLYNKVAGDGSSDHRDTFGYPVPEATLGNLVIGPRLSFDLAEDINVCAGS
jgi:hypothetical protein